MRHFTIGNLVTAVAAVLGVAVGIGINEWWVSNGLEVEPCAAGEVYVVDTEQCVAGDDHSAHNEHAVPETPPAEPVPVPNPDMTCPVEDLEALVMDDLSMFCKGEIQVACHPENFPGINPIYECPLTTTTLNPQAGL